MAHQRSTSATSRLIGLSFNDIPDAIVPVLAEILNVEDPSRDALFRAIVNATPNTDTTFSEGQFYLQMNLPQPPADAFPEELELFQDLTTRNTKNVPPPVPRRNRFATVASFPPRPIPLGNQWHNNPSEAGGDASNDLIEKPPLKKHRALTSRTREQR
ncbi:hypothetical protein HDU81_000577 [Chytriomyces hyalinus]|nr:hypothetical protein HDU81_000577 [Chytriomyces hyalinus]